jgi:hypothetical protein
MTAGHHVSQITGFSYDCSRSSRESNCGVRLWWEPAITWVKLRGSATMRAGHHMSQITVFNYDDSWPSRESNYVIQLLTRQQCPLVTQQLRLAMLYSKMYLRISVETIEEYDAPFYFKLRSWVAKMETFQHNTSSRTVRHAHLKQCSEMPHICWVRWKETRQTSAKENTNWHLIVPVYVQLCLMFTLFLFCIVF